MAGKFLALCGNRLVERVRLDYVVRRSNRVVVGLTSVPLVVESGFRWVCMQLIGLTLRGK